MITLGRGPTGGENHHVMWKVRQGQEGQGQEEEILIPFHCGPIMDRTQIPYFLDLFTSICFSPNSSPDVCFK
jgi:hypothetical protein